MLDLRSVTGRKRQMGFAVFRLKKDQSFELIRNNETIFPRRDENELPERVLKEIAQYNDISERQGIWSKTDDREFMPLLPPESQIEMRSRVPCRAAG